MSEVTGPVVKKAKLNNDIQTIDNFIDYLVTSKKNLQAVLSDEYYKPIPTVKVYLGFVNDIKEMSKIISILNEKIPLKELNHLKRAKKKKVILCPTHLFNSLAIESIQEYLLENISELKDSFKYFEIADVPMYAPKLKNQHLETNKIWSCNFHPNKYMEQLCSGEFFTQDELRNHRLYMGMAFEVARWSLSRTNSNLELSNILLSDTNATVVVDPFWASVVAISFDNRENHPIQHSAMLAIDNVAKTQNGGAWNMETESSGIDKELLEHLKRLYKNTKFGAKTYLNKNDISDSNLTLADCPYLCTGYYIYSIREPCVMCAMGLIHARAKRVFFCVKNSLQGALYSKTKLQCVKSLNHHFEVFTEFIQVSDLITCNIQQDESIHDILPTSITILP